MAEAVTAILKRALRLIAERRGDALAEMVSALDGLAISVTVAREPGLVLRGGGGELREVVGNEGAAIRLETDRGSIGDLLAGRTTLNAALRSGAIGLAGTTGDLARGLRAFEYFVGALLRIDEAEALRRELESRQ